VCVCVCVCVSTQRQELEGTLVIRDTTVVDFFDQF